MAERRECLEHADALDVIDDDAVQPAQLVAVTHEGLIGRPPERHKNEQDQDQRGERHQGQLPVDGQHQDAQQEWNGGGADQLDARVRGEEFDRLYVTDQLGRDRTRLLSGVKTHRQPLQLLVDSHPQTVQDLEGGDMTEPTLEVAADRHQRRGAHHGQAQPDERAGGRRVGQHGQHLPDDDGGQHTEGGVNDRPGDGDREQAAMAACDRQHARKKGHEQAILSKLAGHERTAVALKTRSATSAWSAVASRGSAFSIGVRLSSIPSASAFALASMSMS